MLQFFVIGISATVGFILKVEVFYIPILILKTIFFFFLKDLVLCVCLRWNGTFVDTINAE